MNRKRAAAAGVTAGCAAIAAGVLLVAGLGVALIIAGVLTAAGCTLLVDVDRPDPK